VSNGEVQNSDIGELTTDASETRLLFSLTVDVLVMGVSHVVGSLSQDPNDGTLSPTRKARLTIDLEAYRSCFLATFRSLCTPIVLFEFLRKRFIAAENASRELSLPEQYRPSSQFPSWSMMPSSTSQADPIDTEIVTRIRLGVIEVLRLWVKRFTHDFADDSELFEGVHSFLRDTTKLIVSEGQNNRNPNQDTELESERIRILSALEELDRSFRIAVLAVNNGKEVKNQRSSPKSSDVAVSSNSPPTSIDWDVVTPADLVDYLEVIGALFFDKVHEHDLLVATEVFENQASDPLGWFSARFGPKRNPDDEVPTPSMYKLLENLRPVKKDAASLLERLPTALSDVCAAQNLIRGWVSVQV